MNCDKYTLSDFIEYSDDDIFAKARFFYDFSEDYKNKKYYTFFREVLTKCGPIVKINDIYTGKEKEMLMMASNNYLGLSYHPEVIEAGIEALKKYGASFGGSPLLCGYSDLHSELEKKLARFKSCEAAMVYPSGFSTNLGAIAALVRNNDLVISDRLDHASIVDGCLFSGVVYRNFRHNDMDNLAKVLKRYAKEKRGKLIIVDSVFSMDGDISPLDQIKELANEFGARLMVDEAHGTGVLGKNGRGGIEHFGLEGFIDIVMGTMSKSLGAMGGFICSTKEVINYLRFYSRPYLFSASISPVIVASVSKAIDLISNNPELRVRLWENINYMKDNLVKLGFSIGNSQSAILPIIIKNQLIARKVAFKIHEKGLFVNNVFYPAVPRNSSRIRLSLMATHTKEHIDEALNILNDVGKEYKLI